MENINHEVKMYENKQRTLRKEKESLKKKVPYFLFGFLFFAFGAITLLDGKCNEYLGNSNNLILISLSLLLIISFVYLIMVGVKIKQKNAEIKNLGNKLYKLMKL